MTKGKSAFKATPIQESNDLSAEIRLDQPAQRIVCLTATGLDCLVELGLEPVGYLNQGVADRPEFYGDRARSFMNAGSWIFPNWKAIRQSHPDLILGWHFPHRFYKQLNRIAPLLLVEGAGYDAAVARLQRVGRWTGRERQGKDAIATLTQQIRDMQRLLQHQSQPTVIVMGGATINRRLNCYPVETDTGTVGSVLQQFTNFPWSKPKPERREVGLIYLSLQRILTVDPDIIFVQSFSPKNKPLSEQLHQHPTWRQLKAVQTQQVYEIEPFWHWGNGTRLIGLMLERLLPLIYPQSFAETNVQGVR
ncbi:Fe(3+)-citrate-binding protein YfmC [Acaryochloris thomasi RCC1774]|uniref:Fe(3+)-citrate-binding protein YfmC n=1 Tax=Acaryochloris thomasi RCC1774 TaxID=1764569 RepID=A0A2W1JUZ2_9CYAN|nr:ABC transporter substrate-binding protein [Acaryochloris thomasi]PZD72611.1 Fe(3+)-citrate-binding protein YfmC [Acaryochloris thomasi RCC1774]